jgi:photosystem I P700 chlorophyll a apoprotein A1
LLYCSFFISGIHFDGAYFSNHCAWLKDAKDYNASAHLLWSLIGQDILNSDIGNYFQGLVITSGIFQLWRAQGSGTQISLKCDSSGSLIGTIISLTLGYFHMHSFCSSSFTSLRRVHYLIVLFVLFGLSSITWSGHCIHIAYPANGLLDAGIDPVVIPCLEDLLLKDCPSMSIGYSQDLASGIGFSRLLNSGMACLFIGTHLAVVFITSSLIALQLRRVGINLGS